MFVTVKITAIINVNNMKRLSQLAKFVLIVSLYGLSVRNVLGMCIVSIIVWCVILVSVVDGRIVYSENVAAYTIVIMRVMNDMKTYPKGMYVGYVRIHGENVLIVEGELIVNMDAKFVMNAEQ